MSQLSTDAQAFEQEKARRLLAEAREDIIEGPSTDDTCEFPACILHGGSGTDEGPGFEPYL